MRSLSSVLIILLSLPTCAHTVVSQEDVTPTSPSVIIVAKTSPDDGSPWCQSIQQALDQAKPGDTILVKEGTYHETVTVTKEDITIAAFDPCRPPVIDGADQAFGRPVWEHVQGKVYRTSYKWYKPQLTHRQFNEYGGGESANSIAMQVYEDGILLRGYVGGWESYGTNDRGDPYSDVNQLDPTSAMFYPGSWYKQEIRIPGRFMYDEWNGKLYVWSAAEDSPDNHVYSIPVLEHLVVLLADDITLRHLVLTNSAGYAVVVEDGADGARIEDCCFISDMYAIYMKRADDVRIARNFIQEKGFWERYWYWDCKNTVLWAHAIAMEHYSDSYPRHTEIQGNVIHGYYAAILADGDVAIHDNILSHCMSTHINIDNDCPEVRVYRNICHHVDDTSIGPGVSGGAVWVFRNLFYHCGSLNKAGTEDANAVNKRCYFYHNTLALSKVVPNHPYEYPVFGRHVYRNNIFHLQYLAWGNEFYWFYEKKEPALGWDFIPFKNGPDADYNLYWIGPTNPYRWIAFFSYSKASAYYYDDFAKLQQETGLDPHGLQASPMFRGTLQLDEKVEMVPYDTLSIMDYHEVVKAGLPHLLEAQYQRFTDVFAVQQASPAVDRGVQLPSDWPDVIQALDGKPDIGAWELSPTGAPAWAQ